MQHDDQAPGPAEPIGWDQPPPDQEPATLVGMREEFLDFYECERPLLERFLMMLGASRQDAEDGAHDAFAEAWRVLVQGEWDQVGNRRAWVRKVARCSCKRPPGQRRSAQDSPMAPDDLPATADTAPDHAELTVQAALVLDALVQLNNKQAAAVIALDLDGFATAEEADILDVSEQRVRDLRKKARGHLERYLAATTDDRKEESDD